MSLWEVFDAEAELRANPPIHVLYADIMSSKYKHRFRTPINGAPKLPEKQGSAAELRQLAQTLGKGIS